MAKMKTLALAHIDLGKYSKDKPESDPAWTTSVSLTQKHRQFLEKKNLNFSELVRDFLNSLMENDK